MGRTSQIVAAAAASCLVLAACSSGDVVDQGTTPTSDAGDQQVTLLFEWWGGDTRAELQQEVIDAFEAEHPNIKIQPDYSNWDDYWTKLNTRAAAADLPDVFTVIDPFMYEYIENGRLLDLSTMGEHIDLDSIPENLFSMVEEDGAIYGTPAGVSAFGIIVDPQAFEDAGVPLPDGETWTWDDLIVTAAAISEANPEMVGFPLPMDSQVSIIHLRQQGQDWGPLDGSGEGLGFTPEGIASYWEWVVRLQESGATQAPDVAVEDQAAQAGIEASLIATNRAAMSVISANQLASLEAAAGREFQFMTWPSESQSPQLGAWAKPGVFYSINAATEHPEEAAIFMDYITNSPEAARIMMFERGMHPNPDVVAELEPELGAADQRFAQYVVGLTEKDLQPFYRMDTGAGNIHVATFDAINQDVIFGNLTPEEAGQLMFDEMTAALS